MGGIWRVGKNAELEEVKRNQAKWSWEPWTKEQKSEGEEETVSREGRIAREMIAHVTGDNFFGSLIRSGELRKKITEPPWPVPDCFVTEDIQLENFSMKMLSSKENPREDYVILQIHGGGYVLGVRNAYYVFAGLYNEVGHGMSVLTPDYRVAPEHVFPAALEDAVASYQWLLDRGWSGDQIIVGGDSAGGGLAIAMCMYLRDHGMPMPAGIVAMSPWTDVTASGPSYKFNFTKDPLFGNTKDSMLYENEYPGDHDRKDPYLSPLFGSFSGFPPMLIQVGSIEMLLSDSELVAEKAKKQGVKVRLSIYEGMFHVFQMAYLNIPESRRAWQEVGRFIRVVTENK